MSNHPKLRTAVLVGALAGAALPVRAAPVEFAVIDTFSGPQALHLLREQGWPARVPCT